MDPATFLDRPAPERPLCGVWVDDDGGVHLCRADGGARTGDTSRLRPFYWRRADGEPPCPDDAEPLRGPGPLNRLVHAADWASARAATRALADAEAPGSAESQWLQQSGERLFAGLPWNRLRRLRLDIETAATDTRGFSDPTLPDDRVLAIGLEDGSGDHTLVLEAEDDDAERRLLFRFNALLARLDPDILEGHNIFKFDLDYLRQRCRRLKVPCAWGRWGLRAEFRNSRLRVAERQLDFPRCDIPGRAVVDTWFLVQLHDVSAREMPGYGLKESALHFGITSDDDARTYLAPAAIQAGFREDRERFLAYLRDDLRETRGLADLLLPTYVEQARTFPMTLQDAVLRGTSTKIDLLFTEAYYRAREALPVPQAVEPFEGGLTLSPREGVFARVLHFDVASLYPSLLLRIGRGPAGDSLGLFLPLLRALRTYRLRYKELARHAPDAETRAEAASRQAVYKILINSFYGYLGFNGARFSDGALAAEVTAAGRDLLQRLVARLAELGCATLEADTDGIYCAAERWWDDADGLLGALRTVLPDGIDLEFDGRYEAMFCYKAKNYALREGDALVVRGSALRSRGTEPFLRTLTDNLVRHVLGLPAQPPRDLVDALRVELAAGRLPVERVARTEVLGQGAEAYRAFVEKGGKPRRAALEAALQVQPPVRAGDRIRYYIGPKAKGQTADWQRARPLQAHGPDAPYDPAHYLGKLDDWVERYGRYAGLELNLG